MNISQYYRAAGYDPFDVAIPLTFHIKTSSDPEYACFEQEFKRNEFSKCNQNVWIIKPGEDTNRGSGIIVSRDFAEIKNLVRDKSAK